MFCPGWQIDAGCFVRGGKKWHGMFCPGMFCPTFFPSMLDRRKEPTNKNYFSSDNLGLHRKKNCFGVSGIYLTRVYIVNDPHFPITTLQKVWEKPWVSDQVRHKGLTQASYKQDCVKFKDFQKTFLLFSRTENL